ncbi:MAG TPA: alpha/beta fold hydrolase [Pseudonocardiaceae bacterium]
MQVRDARPVVYLLHGLLGTAYAHFGAQITRWTTGHRVVPVDLPGHGRCPLDAGDRYLDQSLDYVLAVLERFGRGRLVAASHLGGPLAVRAAAARPDLVDSLVLTGFAPGLERGAFLGLLAGFHRLAAEHPPLAAEYERLHGGRWAGTLDAFSAHVGRDFEGTALVRPEALAALDVDTFICNGSHKSVERDAARGAARLGPRVRGRVLDGAGHIASLDAPDAFTTAVEDFWLTRERSVA